MATMIQTIQKRSGEIVSFDRSKIEHAILKALTATQKSDPVLAKALAKDVEMALEERFSDSVPTVEQTQDIVEEMLIQYGYPETAKAYILYRAKRAEQRADQAVVVEVEKTIEEYLERQDWRVQANSNQGYSLGGLILNTAGKVSANYWLSHVYPEEIGALHREGAIHIHDLDMLCGYCAGWSLRQLLEEGFNGVSNKVESDAPKHLSSAVSQMVNFLGTLQNEWAGAQAFSSMDTYLAPFVHKYRKERKEELVSAGASFPSEEAFETYLDNEVYKYAYQNMQSLVFNLNVPSRWGTQTPFTNVTFDWICPDDMKEKRLIMGGKDYEKTFGELQKEMNLINRVYIEVMMHGDRRGRAFTFPIPTYNIGKDFEWEDPKNLPLFEMTAKYGTPYFQNFINSDLNPGDVRSMCCRLQLDLTELKKRGGGLFGSAEMTGSIGVVTINSARLGYLSEGDEQKFFDQLGYLMDLARTSLEMKRDRVQRWMDQGLFPFTKRYLGSLRSHFSTIGISGLNEGIRNLTGDQETIASPKGQEFANQVLVFMRDRLKQYQEDTGNLYNLEASPAEGATYRFAKEDQKRFEGICQAGTPEAPYYTNSSQLPVGYTDDVFEALDLQDSLQTKYTGGTVFHAYLGERVSSAETCRRLVRSILEKYRLPYLTITPTFSICPVHGYLTGEHDFCPRCDEVNGQSLPTKDDSLAVKHRSSAPQR